jgi:hypothetical protein
MVIGCALKKARVQTGSRFLIWMRNVESNLYSSPPSSNACAVPMPFKEVIVTPVTNKAAATITLTIVRFID